EEPDQNALEAKPNPDPSDLHPDEPDTASDDMTVSPDQGFEDLTLHDDADGEEEQQPLDGIDNRDTRPRPTPKPPKPGIMERFAKSQGFRKDGEDRFFHESGSWIGKANGARFPWEHRTAGG